jgi:hypothetical protein
MSTYSRSLHWQGAQPSISATSLMPSLMENKGATMLKAAENICYGMLVNMTKKPCINYLK